MSDGGMSWLISWKNPHVVQARRIWWRSSSLLGFVKSITGISSSFLLVVLLLVLLWMLFVTLPFSALLFSKIGDVMVVVEAGSRPLETQKVVCFKSKIDANISMLLVNRINGTNGCGSGAGCCHVRYTIIELLDTLKVLNMLIL
jgi:hypothetical protein